MKKVIIALVAIVAIVTASCQRQGGEIEWKTYTYKDSLSESIVSLVFDAEMELPESGLTKAVRNNLRNNIILNALGENYVEFSNKKMLKVYADSSLAGYNQFADEFETLNKEIEFTIDCETRIRGAVSFENDVLLNYENRKYIYSGGAHGVSRVDNYIFDLTTGGIISEKDIFSANVDYRLHKLLVEAANILRQDNILPSISDFFSDELVVTNGNIELGENGLSYIYNPYEIAPYAYGVVAIPLDNNKVIPLLNPECPIYGYISDLVEKQN